ncbi:MAG: ABC transporter ATP-binding protein [Planctomycetota bacterium]|nr:ABC transporter ATP-binding protein [Planctomycetota bacterium]
MTDGGPLIELRRLTRKFGDKVAVDRLDLSIAAGEIFAFLGPNGAGKTTTFKVLAGLLRPTEGCALICGRDVHREPMEARRMMSYVPDEPYLYDKLSGREFLDLVGGLYGMSGREIERRVGELKGPLDFDGYLNDLAESYSHGMKQRIAIAAALLHRPRVLIVDEPTVGLDPRSARAVKGIFRDLASAGGAVFLSTHTLSVAEEIADRVGIIHRGRLVACGKVSELKAMGRSSGDLEDIFLQLTGE